MVDEFQTSEVFHIGAKVALDEASKVEEYLLAIGPIIS